MEHLHKSWLAATQAWPAAISAAGEARARRGSPLAELPGTPFTQSGGSSVENSPPALPGPLVDTCKQAAPAATDRWLEFQHAALGAQAGDVEETVAWRALADGVFDLMAAAAHANEAQIADIVAAVRQVRSRSLAVQDADPIGPGAACVLLLDELSTLVCCALHRSTRALAPRQDVIQGMCCERGTPRGTHDVNSITHNHFSTSNLSVSNLSTSNL